jgi:adenine-specific DNA-methyltransferase
MDQSVGDLRSQIFSHLPTDGTAIGVMKLRSLCSDAGEAFNAALAELVASGSVVKRRGRGGSVALNTEPAELPLDDLNDSDADGYEDESNEEDDEAEEEITETKGSKKAASLKSKKVKAKSKTKGPAEIISYRHPEKRKNNPNVGDVSPETDPDQPATRYAYDPHIDPALQFDSQRSATETLIDDALASGDPEVMRAALEQLKRQSSPYLNWAGKAERTSFEVDTVSLHVHERIDPASILATVRKAMRERKPSDDSLQMGLFSAPFENLPLRDAFDFYKHDKGWSNRIIAGDSLLVMNSLLKKESMAGKVQMIYIDPPYGIKYGSNFQPFTGKRDVKDRADGDLTQEPEMIKAFRDTWELGIHSYLTYLRDRLLLAKELLHESGSIFVQIGDENVHRVRMLTDEVFGDENFVSEILVKKTGGVGAEYLDNVFDIIIWYGKNKDKTKYRALYDTKLVGEGEGTGKRYDQIEFEPFNVRPLIAKEKGNTSLLEELEKSGGRFFQLTSLNSDSSSEATTIEYAFEGDKFFRTNWKTNKLGLSRLAKSNRVKKGDKTIRFRRYLRDFSATSISNYWDDTKVSGKIYVVQTADKVVARCILMTTDPGDLVLDPTCGSGTTATVAEQSGRRWITCDTSRVAVTLAKQRLMTASFDYFDLKYPHEGVKGGFIYKTVPHVTLKSIANNEEIDEIYERLHPEIESKLRALNIVLLKDPNLSLFTVTEGGRKDKRLDLKKGDRLEEWEVPFDFPDNWPDVAQTPFSAFWKAKQVMQSAMDRSIADRAEMEPLYDQPQIAKDKLRITGPFSVEAVPFPTVTSLDEAEQPQEADRSIARSGESGRHHQWRDELYKTGIRGKGGQILKFAELETLPDLRHLHASGTIAESGERVVISFGPEYAALEQRQVEMAMREAGELFPRPKMIVFCSFEFDPEAAKDIDQTKGITALKAKMNADLLTEDLKKERSSNQSFWLIGQPDIEPIKQPDGRYRVEVKGFDYFDTVKGELTHGGKGKIAAWFLDTDYDDRSLLPRQVFFPLADKKDGWFKLKMAIRAELDESLLRQFHSTVSLPFTPGEHKKIAVKIVDDRGIESLKVMALD